MQNVLSLPETHPEFRLNGLYYTNEDLAAVAYSLIKEGEPYEGQAGNFLLDWLNDKDYVEVKTSGSTGPPKRIRIKKQQMINSARATGKFFDLGPGTTALHCLPVNFIAGKMMLVRAMLLGWKLDLELPKANPLDRIFKIYDFCAMTPFQLDNSLSRLHLIKKLIVGGGMVSENLNPRTTVLLGAGLEVLHFQSREWLEKIEFWKDEVQFFENLLNSRTFDHGQHDLKALLVNLDAIHENLFEDIEENIRQHEKALSGLLKGEKGLSDADFRRKHQKLMLRMERIEKDFRSFKTIVFDYVKQQAD